MLSHKPPTLSLPILCFRETPLSVKSSLIMTSLFEYQKSTIKCQQFTAVKFKNVSKHGKIISCSFYLTIIVWNRKHFFMGTLKYWYLGHVHPFSYSQCSIVFGDIRVKDFTCNTFLIKVNDKFLSVLH